MNTLRLFLAILAALADPARAVPPGFNVQGRLTDANGVNRDGTFSIKLTLFDAATAGSALWTKTLPAVAVRSGLFQITLGDPPDAGSANANIFAALSGDSRYLEIEVLSGPGVPGPEPPLVPRQQLVSNPFAIRAGSVDNASALTSTGVITFTTAGAERMRIDASGNVGIGTTSPSAAFEVAGTMKMSGATPIYNIKNVAQPIDMDDAATKRFVLNQAATSASYIAVKNSVVVYSLQVCNPSICGFPAPSCPAGMHILTPAVSWNVAEQGAGFSYYEYYGLCNCETWTLCKYP